MNSPTDSSEGYLKVNNTSPSDHTEVSNSHSIKTSIYPQRDQVGVISRKTTTPVLLWLDR